MGYNPTDVGDLITDYLIVPVLDMLPGELSKYLGPPVRAFIGSKAMGKLDAALSRGPHLWPWKWTFGSIYRFVMSQFKYIAQKDLRNYLTSANPWYLLMPYVGAADFSVDSSLARMRKVYHNEECPESTGSSQDDTGCPRHIPAREALLTGVRAGDLFDSPYATMWPGRTWVRVSIPTMNLLSACMSR